MGWYIRVGRKGERGELDVVVIIWKNEGLRL